MSDVVVIHSEQDIKNMVVEHLKVNYYEFEQIFNNYLYMRYGLPVNKFEKILKDLAPEDFI